MAVHMLPLAKDSYRKEKWSYGVLISVTSGYDSASMSVRQYEPCERCGRPAEQWHHTLHRRVKGHPEWDVIYNLEHLCTPCHENKGSYEERRAFYYRQANRYGISFVEWWDGLDIPGKERY